ncbi:hypothetical protein LSH36_533g01049 [Paralvinella palmiformis]|uniref:Biopterin-dependent aromatic amino acid hydroxylase family profile domain-containing protein n=1 Tax=Paralvinella palmiformis TaxID=53620 RepID=A0AAD9J8W8_9ANNE|nr:hypothetical protein LSH36_533g01049 [Paralvinella palmiformis]
MVSRGSLVMFLIWITRQRESICTDQNWTPIIRCTIFRELNILYPKYACKEYLQNLPLLKEHCGYCEEALPQLDIISKFLKERTGFTLRPVAGYLSSRDFLSGLAFRLLGHMPLFLDPSFAEFSQEIGLSSLGASDQEVEKLATLYFFTIEFGLCRDHGQYKVYGAGLLSCVSELKHVLSKDAIIKRFDPATTCDAECRITTFQDAYYYTETFEEAKEQLREYAHSIKRPFELHYDPYTQTVEILDTAKRISKALDDVTQQLATVNNAVRKFSCR